MTVTVFRNDHAGDPTAWRQLRRFLRVALFVMRRRRRVARSHLDLAHLDERLLYDLGIDPLDVRGALADHHAKAALPVLARRRSTEGK